MKNYYYHKCIYEGKLRNEPLKQDKYDPLIMGYCCVAVFAVILCITVVIIF